MYFEKSSMSIVNDLLIKKKNQKMMLNKELENEEKENGILKKIGIFFAQVHPRVKKMNVMTDTLTDMFLLN